MKIKNLLYTGFLLSDRAFYYGEWSVWYSNLPKFMGPNKIMVNLFPHDEIQISHKKYLGPFLYEKKWSGKYTLSETPMSPVPPMSSATGTALNNLENPMASSSATTMVEETPVCESIVDIEFSEIAHFLVSFFGIGVDELAPLTVTKSESSRVRMELQIVGSNDIFLVVENQQLHPFLRRPLPLNKTTSYHLVRSVQNDQPKVNVPISTFIVTQLLGTLMGYFIHDQMCH